MASAAVLHPYAQQQLEALGLHTTSPPEGMRNPSQLYTLADNEEYVLDPSVDNLQMGLGWDQGADVDASVAFFTSDRTPTDMVWWRKLTSKCKSVRHSGDDRNGARSGYDETISINLSEVPMNVHYLLFSVNIYSYGWTFDKVRRAFVDMINTSSGHRGKVMCSYQLSKMRGNSMLMGMLVRRGAYWNFKALGLPATGRAIDETVKNRKNLECLYQTYSCAPQLRYVQVSVMRGIGLLACDSPTFWSRASSDPYHIMKFKSRKFKSEYVPKTTDPAWRGVPFVLGPISESEPAPLEISLYDYDQISEDDFMGSVVIPATMLYNCGEGVHEYWFDVGTTKQQPFRANTQLGKIQVIVDVRNV